MPLKWKLSVGFAIPVVLIVGISALVYQSMHSLVASADDVNHTYKAIHIGDELVMSMIDMETGLRGFLVTGKELFLEPYIAGNQSFTKGIADDLNHVRDNPTQVERLKKVETLKDERLSLHAEKSIKLRNQATAGKTSLEQVQSFVEQGHGRKRMDEIRVVLSSLRIPRKNW